MNLAAQSMDNVRLIQNGLNILSMLNLTSFLFPQDYDFSQGLVFDYIIVGAGAAGSVVANRLTECEGVNVLLIEAGGDSPVESFIPGLVPYLQQSKYDWNYKSENDGCTQQCKKNNVLQMARGKALGGSSILNYMAYTRGNPHDYALWADADQDPSWNWDQILKYFIKSEKYDDMEVLNSPFGDFHGTDGYLGVTKYHYNITNKYFAAFTEMGHEVVLDTNAFKHLGFSDLQLTIQNDIRQSTAYSFLTPIKDSPNLFVMKNALATKIIFDEYKNAVGVEVVSKYNQRIVLEALQEVIISAGAINTPQLLMLSGIGPGDHLLSHGISVVVDNYDVGKNLQDHIPILTVHKMKISDSKPKPRDPRKLFPYTIGYVALNKTQDYPDYQAISIAFEDYDIDSILQFCTSVYLFDDEICTRIYESCKGRETFFSVLSLLNPESKGEILLRNADPFVYPLIYTGFYTNNRDLERHIDCVMDFLKIGNTAVFQSMEAELVDVKASMCAEFDRNSREFMKCYVLCMMASQYHYAGTASMGKVVDNRLKVYGVNRLRVIDASIMPHIVSANTYAPTVMVAEKGADMIKEDRGLICETLKDNGI